nr:MAG TPA: hypothetical protein [Caudoviricetes sp.]
MLKCENGKFIEVSDFIVESEAEKGGTESDKVTALAEKLSTATSLAQIRDAAKFILKEESEAKNE